jgi:hypothetical protein
MAKTATRATAQTAAPATAAPATATLTHCPATVKACTPAAKGASAVLATCNRLGYIVPPYKAWLAATQPSNPTPPPAGYVPALYVNGVCAHNQTGIAQAKVGMGAAGVYCPASVAAWHAASPASYVTPAGGSYFINAGKALTKGQKTNPTGAFVFVPASTPLLSYTPA